MTTSFPTVTEIIEMKRVAQAKEHGFAFFAIKSDGQSPAFAYTVGLAQHGFPELMCFADDNTSLPSKLNMMANLCSHILEGLKRFPAPELASGLIKAGVKATDPDIHYQPELLRGDDLAYAYRCYVTRAMYLRDELGTPKGVLVLNHEGAPTLQEVRCRMMLSAS